jgi:hypothetical protein
MLKEKEQIKILIKKVDRDVKKKGGKKRGKLIKSCDGDVKKQKKQVENKIKSQDRKQWITTFNNILVYDYLMILTFSSLPS